MSSLGFSSLGPIGHTGTAPLPVLTSGSGSRAFSPQPVIRRPAVATSGVGDAPPAANPPGSAATTAPAPAAPASQTPARVSAGAPGAAAAAIAVEELATGYSTKVGGVEYAASVFQSNGQYTASVSSLTGATATGSTEQVAEENLAVRIDVLV
jgi:hypothetical protein